MFKTTSFALVLAVTGAAAAYAASDMMTSIPSGSRTVTDWYKQSVYDTHQNKIGSVDDVLVDGSGKVSAVMVGVGGFLGAGEKDVAVSFSSVRAEKKKDEWYLTMDTTKDALKNAPGYKYDKASTTWVPENK